MNTAEWFSELSREMQLPYFDRNIFGEGKGVLIGTRDGYLIMVGLAKSDKSSVVRVVLRHGAADPGLVKQAVKQELGKFKGPIQEAGTVAVDRKYSFGKPKPSEIAEGTASLFTALKSVAPPLNGKCEKCQREEKQITLFNGLPGYHCLSCQQEIAHKANAAAEEYDRLDTNLPLGILYGALAAVAGSLAWGFVAYGINRIFLYGAIGIGALVSIAVVKGIGKIDWPGRIVIGVLTLASIVFGDVILYTLNTMKEANLPFSFTLLREVMAQFWDLETKNGIPSLIFGLIGAGVVMYRARRPEFKAQFEPLT